MLLLAVAASPFPALPTQNNCKISYMFTKAQSLGDLEPHVVLELIGQVISVVFIRPKWMLRHQIEESFDPEVKQRIYLV